MYPAQAQLGITGPSTSMMSGSSPASAAAVTESL